MTRMEMIVGLLLIYSMVDTSNAMPLAKRIVDMTYVFDETTQPKPTIKRFTIDSLFNGSNPEFNLDWAQLEEYSSSTHVGTHIDAPAHALKGGAGVDKIPLPDLIAPAAVIDITAKAELNVDALATVEDLVQWESTTGQSLNGTIVLLRFGWGSKWNDLAAFQGTDELDFYKWHFPGWSAEACQWLVDNRSIKGVGSEAASFDAGPALDFPAHKIILKRGLFGLENVANMDKLPLYGAKLYVFPMKIGKGSGAPTRIVAIIPEVIYSTSNQ